MAVGTEGGAVGVGVGAINKEIVAHCISLYVCMHAKCIHTFYHLLCYQSLFGNEDSKIIARALYPKKFYLANCIVMGSTR